VGRLWEVVAPGGNGSRHADHLLRQQGKQEFPVKPSTAAAIVVLGQVSELGDGFHAFEVQLDLPSQPIGFQHFGGRGLLGGKRGEDQHIVGALARQRSYGLSFLHFVLQPAFGSPDRILALANGAQPAADLALASLHLHSPFHDSSSLVQGPQASRQIEPVACLVIQREGMRIQTNTNIGLCGGHGLDPWRIAIAGIGQNQFSGPKTKLAEAFRGACATRGGENEIVTLQRRQAQTVMDTPLAARLPGSLTTVASSRRT